MSGVLFQQNPPTQTHLPSFHMSLKDKSYVQHQHQPPSSQSTSTQRTLRLVSGWTGLPHHNLSDLELRALQIMSLWAWLNFETLKCPGAWALRKCELVPKDNAHSTNHSQQASQACSRRTRINEQSGTNAQVSGNPPLRILDRCLLVERLEPCRPQQTGQEHRTSGTDSPDLKNQALLPTELDYVLSLAVIGFSIFNSEEYNTSCVGTANKLGLLLRK
jgi:hypothetical protein